MAATTWRFGSTTRSLLDRHQPEERCHRSCLLGDRFAADWKSWQILFAFHPARLTWSTSVQYSSCGSCSGDHSPFQCSRNWRNSSNLRCGPEAFLFLGPASLSCRLEMDCPADGLLSSSSSADQRRGQLLQPVSRFQENHFVQRPWSGLHSCSSVSQIFCARNQMAAIGPGPQTCG